MHGFTSPPAEQNEEGHPEQHELDAEIDGTGFSHHRRRHRLMEQVIPDVLHKVEYRYKSMRSKCDKRKQDKAKPPYVANNNQTEKIPEAGETYV
jgi:hypothetical protein